MHFLVLGGSGRSGQLIIHEALSNGHSVTALARSATSFPIKAQENLTIVEGTPLNRQDVTRAFTSSTLPDAVLSALAARRTSDSPFAPLSPDTPKRLMADSIANVVSEIKDRGAKTRLVIMSSWGCGDSWDSMNFLLKGMFNYTNMKHGLVDHDIVDQETRASSVNFVLVRPAMLAEGDAQEVKVFPDNGKGIACIPKVTRASVAKFMVEACGKDDFLGKSPVISN
ncbi:NAD(P)-binding protein [Xylariaceae sp. FL0016]|nr:NAD(P)-binding protein [Xylariaceae sp. FL0016]